MSPRAACRLEALGFEKVFDYELGIADWKAGGLATDGNGRRVQTVADAMRPDIPTCDLSEQVGDVEKRVRESGWEDCVAIDCEDLVVGRLRASSWNVDPSSAAAEVMELGPTTVRPSDPLDSLVARMEKRPTPLVVVATPQGNLLGVILLEDARRVLAGESSEMIWEECDGCPGQWRPADN